MNLVVFELIGVFFVASTTCSIIKSKRSFSITPITSCKVQLDDGLFIDLTSLDDALNPR